MRMMLSARLDTETANKAVTEGTMGKVIEGVVEQLKPEAVYFTPNQGHRGIVLVFDMQDPSQMPSVAEPFFQSGAEISLQPAMNLDDLRTGLSRLGK